MTPQPSSSNFFAEQPEGGTARIKRQTKQQAPMSHEEQRQINEEQRQSKEEQRETSEQQRLASENWRNQA